MIKFEDRPFTPRMFTMSLRGTKDDAMNGFNPEVNIADPKSPRFGSSEKDDPQRWTALALDENETDLLLRISAMVADDEEVSKEGRFLAQMVNTLLQASITNFVTYEQRKAEDLPASTPIAS
jgi:hypothetical protein